MVDDEITLRVSPEAARAFREASSQDRLKPETLASLQLLGELRPRRTYGEVMADMSAQAAERSLTPELLQELLRHGE